jgi:hypothetical protein
MEKPKRSAKKRQLALLERRPCAPTWSTLPEDCRREVVQLFARLLRPSQETESEAGDE